jgi:hypothetical protein
MLVLTLERETADDLVRTSWLELEPNPTNPLAGGASLESALNVRKKTPVGSGQRIDAPRARRIGATTRRWSGLSPSKVLTGS